MQYCLLLYVTKVNKLCCGKKSNMWPVISSAVKYVVQGWRAIWLRMYLSMFIMVNITSGPMLKYLLGHLPDVQTFNWSFQIVFQLDPLTGLNIPSSSLPPTPATPTTQLPSFPPHPLTGTALGPSNHLGAVGSIGSGLSQAVQKPQSQLGQLPLTTPTTSSSGMQSPSFSSSQNPLLQQFHQASGLGQSLGGSAMDNARLLAGLGIHKQLGGSLLQHQQQQQQQQTALLSQSRNQADKLRQGKTV